MNSEQPAGEHPADGGTVDRSGVDWLDERAAGPLRDVPTDPVEVLPVTGPVDIVVRPPGSKSITNRALVCAALASGDTELSGVLFADDTIAMMRSLMALGVSVHPGDAGDRVVVSPPTGAGAGVSPDGPRTVEHGGTVDRIELDADLSGTTARFVMPVAAVLADEVHLDGGEPLRRRPMSDLVGAMGALGAQIDATQPGDRLPLTIRGDGFSGGRVEVPGDVSSQFLSALLLVGPALSGGLTIRLTTPLVSRPYVTMTLAVMESFGAEVRWDGDELFAGGTYRSPGRYVIEPDASAASYFLAAAALTGGAARIAGLGTNALQGDIHLVDLLADMGMDVRWEDEAVSVASTGVLHGTSVDMKDVSDVAQTLAVIATAADSPTTVTGIGFIRGKETDRISAVVTELRRLGIDAREESDGFVVHPGRPVRGVVHTYDDHRMAMSFAVLGLAHPGIKIADPHCVSKTYPGFWQDLSRIRLQHEET